jgi:hypothetical protein
MVSALAACGVDVRQAKCGTYAKTERREVAEVYTCIAALPCDASEEAHKACITLAPSDFGTRLCNALGEAIACSAQDEADLNEHGAWLRDDVKNAALECADATNPKDCIRAWKSAVPR